MNNPEYVHNLGDIDDSDDVQAQALIAIAERIEKLTETLVAIANNQEIEWELNQERKRQT